MVRRRSASPKASAPVRRSSPAPSQTPAPAGPMRSSAPPPPGAPASGGGGFMSQLAATAGGVAIGSAVGHAVGNMFSGSGSREDTSASVSQEYAPQQKQHSSPCEFEWRQFLECAQNQSDVGICQSFNDIFKQCQARYAGQ